LSNKRQTVCIKVAGWPSVLVCGRSFALGLSSGRELGDIWLDSSQTRRTIVGGQLLESAGKKQKRAAKYGQQFGAICFAQMELWAQLLALC